MAAADDRWWEKRLKLDPAALSVVDFCWKRFAEARAWPSVDRSNPAKQVQLKSGQRVVAETRAHLSL